MPEFTYTARDLSGKRVEGTLAAGTEREVIAALSARELFPLKVTSTDRNPGLAGSPRVSAKVMATAYSQMSALIKSGVPLLRSLEIIRQQTSNKKLSRVMEDVHSRVQEGATLADAMARHPRAFGELGTSIVRAGGEGGFLEEALDRLAKFTEQQDELKSRVIGALAYPMILFVLGTLVVNGLIIFFVPKFETLFARLRARGELPAVTDWLLWLSHTMQSYGLFIVAGIVVAVFVIRSRLSTEEGRVWLDRWRLKVPVVSGIYLSLAVSRFCRVLGTLLSGGVPIVRSLEISADSTGNRILSSAVREAAANISAGQALAQPLAASGHFPADVVEMIAVAEQSNSLETVLPHIADTLERDTWRRLDLFVRLLEPLMLLLLAGVVLLVVIALLVPVLKMSSGLIMRTIRWNEMPFTFSEEYRSMNDPTTTYRRCRASRREGFTLMEVLLVLVILVVLASMAVTIFGGTQQRALKDAAKAQVGIFKGAVNLYKFHTKNFPTGLSDLINKPSDSTAASHWEGPYIEGSKIPLDPWDHEYKFAAPGKHNSDGFDIWSTGPDGQDGNEDDIGNWE